ncbi:MAG: glycosyltransferase [Actinomycetota bacterium]|nr:glycosyltransferase [Actinomycetota bacterium]
MRTAEALSRLAELLAETCPPPSPEPVEYQLPWGNDAAAHPPDYWHRIHLDRLQASESQRRPELPTDGPLVSVIVPVYRPSHWYFVECARSVAAQTYTNWELCLCDDASGDPEQDQQQSADDENTTASPGWTCTHASYQNGTITCEVP